MSYTTENAKDNVARDMMIVLRPRYRITSWTLYSGSVYYAPWTYGYVTSLYETDTAMTSQTSTSLSATQYYYDHSAQRIYMRMTDSAAPASTDFLIVTFEMHLATKECYWHRVPTDDSTTEVFWRGILTQTPTVSRNASDIIFGFIPTSVTGLSCVNEPTYFQKIIHDLSFNTADALVYHVAGDIETANIQQIFGGYCGDYSFNDKELNVTLLDKGYRMNEKWSNGTDGRDYYQSAGSNVVQPDRIRTTIKSCFGSDINDASQVLGVNVDFDDSSPTTSENRDWAFTTRQSAESGMDIPIVTVNTATNFTVSTTNAKKLVVGDFVRRTGAGYTAQITSVNTSSGVVVFDNAPDTTGSLFRVTGAYNAKLVQSDVVYSLLYERDYTDSSYVDILCWGIQLRTTAEANAGAATIDPNNGDYIVAEIRGQTIAPTSGGSPFYTGIHPHSNPIVILYHILKDRMGFAESDIDLATFASFSTDLRLKGNFRPIVSLTSPDTIGDDFSNYGDVIALILASCFCRLFINNEGKFTLSAIEAFDSADKTISDDDLISVNYEYGYGNTGKINVFSRPIETSTAFDKGTQGAILPISEAVKYPYDLVNYDVNKYLHKSEFRREVNIRLAGAIDSTKTTLNGADEYDFSATYSENASDCWKRKFKHLVGERKSILKCQVKSGAHGLDIGSFVTVTRSRQPGFDYDESTTNSRNYVVIEITKGLGGVDMVLDDQKGVEDNTGDW